MKEFLIMVAIVFVLGMAEFVIDTILSASFAQVIAFLLTVYFWHNLYCRYKKHQQEQQGPNYYTRKEKNK